MEGHSAFSAAFAQAEAPASGPAATGRSKRRQKPAEQDNKAAAQPEACSSSPIPMHPSKRPCPSAAPSPVAALDRWGSLDSQSSDATFLPPEAGSCTSAAGSLGSVVAAVRWEEFSAAGTDLTSFAGSHCKTDSESAAATCECAVAPTADCASWAELPAAARGEVWVPSPEWFDDLEEANRCVAGMPLPGSIEFVPVSGQCPVAQTAGAWGLPPICVVLGASYFERLMMRHNWMGATAADLGFFRHNGQDWELCGVPSHELLLAAYLQCVLLAAKVADRVPYKGLLSIMMDNLMGVTMDDKYAATLERSCLEGLDYRLGPYFNPDVL